MRVYLAAPWVSRGDMVVYASLLEKAGCKITHKWWEVEDIPESERTIDVLREQAEMDVFGVQSSDCVILINSGKSEGKAVEQGIAIARNIPIIAVGRRGEFSKNVFHYLGLYYWVDDFEGALKIIDFVKHVKEKL